MRTPVGYQLMPNANSPARNGSDIFLEGTKPRMGKDFNSYLLSLYFGHGSSIQPVTQAMSVNH